MLLTGNTYKVLDEQSMSQSISGSSLDVGRFVNWNVHFVWTGTPVGTLSIEASPDLTSWTAITGSSQATAGESGSHVVNYSGNSHRYIRTIFTYSSGSGSLSTFFTGN